MRPFAAATFPYNRAMRAIAAVIFIGLSATLLGACGMSGDLYLPAEALPAAVTPASPAGTAAEAGPEAAEEASSAVPPAPAETPPADDMPPEALQKAAPRPPSRDQAE